mgnify:CR=1 FL=1
MNLRSQKKLAAKILKCGVSRVRMESTKDVAEAITREDIRNLIKKGLIKAVQKKGTSKAYSKIRKVQKKKGRRKGPGSRKGKKGARMPKKEAWMKQIRALRKLLRELRDSEKIERKTYRKVLLMAKGGAFRSKKHMLYYLKERELLKK